MRQAILLTALILLGFIPAQAQAACSFVASGDYNCGNSPAPTPGTAPTVSTTIIQQSPLTTGGAGEAAPIFSAPSGNTLTQAQIDEAGRKLQEAVDTLCPKRKKRKGGTVIESICAPNMANLSRHLQGVTPEEILAWPGPLVSGSKFMGIELGAKTEAEIEALENAEIAAEDAEAAKVVAQAQAQAAAQKLAHARANGADADTITRMEQEAADAQAAAVEAARVAAEAAAALVAIRGS